MLYLYILFIYLLYILYFIYIYIIMDKKITKFDDTEIEKYEFHQFKYFIGYKDNKKIKPLCIFFPETNVY